MIKRSLLVIFGVLSMIEMHAQAKDLKNEGYYRNPMDIPTLLSANFAELRANHFHAGIDIKTQGVEGKRVYAAAQGYIARAGISPGGYGKTIYIAHPNGTTTVYAHLQMFTPEMENYINDWRYTNKKHSGDVYFKSSQFALEQGDFIGLSGNTGMSGGPHLHYEVRETATQYPTNVIARGYLTVNDNIPPRIIKLYCVGMDTIGDVPIEAKPKAIDVTEISPGNYSVASTVNIPLSCYFLVETTDRRNDVTNKFGIYSIKETVNGETVFELTLDKFAFDKTRYKHAVSYYGLQRKSANEVFRLAKMQGNRLDNIYGKVKNRGIIKSNFSQQHDISIDVTDDSGNISTVSFKAKAPSSVLNNPPQTTFSHDSLAAYYNKPFNHSQDKIEVLIPSGALYQSMFYTQSIAGPQSQIYKTLSTTRKLYAPIYTVGDYDTPLHKAMTISIETDAPAQLRSKLCLAYINEGGKISSAAGSWAQGKVSGDSRTMGRFTVVADTIPPRVTPSFASGANLDKTKQISFKITDDFAGIWDFQGTIDGKWILFEWNIPQARIIHNFDSSRFDYSGKTHELRVVVTDGKGNETVWEGTFVK